MSSLIDLHKAELLNLCKEYDVKTMHVFGSVVTGPFHQTSDIDFLIAFKELPFDKYTDNYFELHKRLEDLFQRKVDLLTERSLSNPYFIQNIERTKRLLYAA